MTLTRGFSDLFAKGIGLLLASGYFGCSSSSGTAANSSYVPTAGTGGSASSLVQSVRFIPDETVMLEPGATVTRQVEVQPAGARDIGLALLGNSVDAALSQSLLHTADGKSEFSITASSVPAVFEVRATVESQVSLLQVSVSNNGFAAVDVTGAYKGVRHASEWVASLNTGMRCADLGNQLPSDGLFATTSHESTPQVRIPGVSILPDSTNVAVLMRGDYVMWGCSDLPALTRDEVLDLAVDLYDVPVSYPSDPIKATFVLSSAADDWARYLSNVEPDISAGFVQSATSDADLLLGAMNSSLGSSESQVDFSQRRKTGDWDTIVAAWSTTACPSNQCLNEAIDRWLSAGASSVAQGSSIETRLSLSASSVSLNQVQLTLESMHGLAAGAWVASAQVPLGGSLGANDELGGSTYFAFNDGLFLRLLAQSAAIAEFPSTSDIPQALAALVDCDQLAVRFDNAAPSSGSSCSASCLGQLCRSALRNLWTNTETVVRARANSRLDLNFSGKLRLDDHAVVTGCDGTWRGDITTPNGSLISVGGTVH